MRVLVTGATRPHRLGALRRPAGSGRRGRRADPRPGPGAAEESDGPLARMAADHGAPARGGPRGRRRRRQPDRRGDQPAAHRCRRSAASARAGWSAPSNLVAGDRGGRVEAEGLRRPVGDRLLRRPRRPDPRRGSPARRAGLHAEVVRIGRRPSARPAASPRVVVVRTGLVLIQAGRAAQAAPSSLQARRRRADRRRRAVHVVDPHRRRGRAAPLGARQRTRSPAPSTPPPRTRSPTASSRRRSAARSTARHLPGARSSPSALLRGPELADAVAGGARVLPRRAHDLGFDFRHPDLDEALRSALR